MDLQQLAQDILAASAGETEKLASLRERLGRPQLTVENIRAQITGSADSTLTLAAVRTFLQEKFPADAFRIRNGSKALDVSPLIVDSDWPAVFDAMRDCGITCLNAGESIPDAALLQLSQRNDVAVEKLDIAGWHGRLTDEGLASLHKMKQFRDIQLCWQQNITDRGLANLEGCEHLEIVNLLGTNTGDAAIRALSGKPYLRKLSTGRQVSNEGLEGLHEIPRFKHKHSEPARFGLMSFDAEPVHLLLDGPFDEQGVRQLKGLDGLSGLTFFGHCENITPVVAQHLPEVQFFSMDGKLCDDTAMRFLGEKQGLRMLLAQGAVATAVGYRSLSKSPSLEFIWGRESVNFDSDGFRALAALPVLRGFAISCKNVNDHALAMLPDFPALTQFMPMDLTDAGFRHIGRCENLESLWCMYCRETGDVATEHIASLRKLKSYYAGKTLITDRSLEILSKMPSLEKIELWECAGLTDKGIEHLTAMPHLKELTIHGSANVTSAVESMFASSVTVDYLRR